MIQAPPGYWAIYADDNEEFWLRVIAFDSEGSAMVLDNEQGLLERADNASNFKTIKYDMIKWNTIKVEK